MLQSTLLQSLNDLLQGQIEKLNKLKSLDEKALTQPIAPGKWSIAENLEHLLRYGDFYLPEVRQRIRNGRNKTKDSYKSGLLGIYFVESMKPGKKPMSTFKNMNPALSGSVRANAVDSLEAQLNQWVQIIEELKDFDIQKIKTGISISSFIKLRLGDTLGVVIWHQERHFSYFS